MSGLDALLSRAHAEYATASREQAVTVDANPSAVCEHTLGCVLRLLQARLLSGGVPYPSTAHPVVLLECCLEVEPEWERFRNDLRLIHLAAMEAQDPEASDLAEMAEAAFTVLGPLREVMLRSLMTETVAS